MKNALVKGSYSSNYICFLCFSYAFLHVTDKLKDQFSMSLSRLCTREPNRANPILPNQSEFMVIYTNGTSPRDL